MWLVHNNTKLHWLDVANDVEGRDTTKREGFVDFSLLYKEKIPQFVNPTYALFTF